MHLRAAQALPYNCDEAYCEVVPASQDLSFTRLASDAGNGFQDRTYWGAARGSRCVALRGMLAAMVTAAERHEASNG